MALSEEFILKVAEIAHDKTALINLMNELDEEKRSIRSFQRQFSSFPKCEGGLQGAERFKKLRRLKDRISFLIDEREYVRQKLGELNGDQKALKRSMHKKVEFVHAFMAAAERTLSEEEFAELEYQAGKILMQQEGA